MSADLVFIFNLSIGGGGGMLARLGVVAVYFVAIFLVYKIHKARARTGRLSPWRIAAAALFCGMLAFAVIHNKVARDAERHRVRTELSRVGSIPINERAQSQPVREKRIWGRSGGYSILMPAGWEEKTTRGNNMDLCIGATGQPLAVGVVLLESGGDVDLRQYAGKIRDGYLASREGVEATEVEMTTINGREWAGFSDKPPPGGTSRLRYQYYIYNDETRAFLLTGWTTDNVFDDYAPVLDKIMRTFQFPRLEREKRAERPKD